MTKLSYKLILAITICGVTAALILGGFGLNRCEDFIRAEVENKMILSAEKYAGEFSAVYNKTEGIVDAIAAEAEVNFDNEKFKNDPEYFNRFKADLGRLIKKTLSDSKVAQGLYFTFDPEFHEADDEIWFAKKGGKVVYVDAGEEINKRDFSLPPKDDMLYFFNPIWKGKGAWSVPYYDQDINLNILSYSHAVYVGNTLLGVAGADILTEDTIDTVSAMHIDNHGYAFLLDENYNFIAHPTYPQGENMLHVNEGAFQEIDQEMKSKSSGMVSYDIGGEKKILGFSHLENGWILAITQSQKEAFGIITFLKIVLCILGAVILLATLIFAWFFSNAQGKPIAKEKDYMVEENRRRDVMLIYRSRQGNIEEMIGNVTHQWQQPLSRIMLTLAGIQEDYKYGELTEDSIDKSVHDVDEIIRKMSGIVDDFENFLKLSKEKAVFDIHEQICSVMNLMEEGFRICRIEVNLPESKKFLSYGYSGEFAHVVFSILNNAKDAILMSADAERRIDILIEEHEEKICVEIKNNGDQIKEELFSKVFEPFFTTKENADENATGLGLYICKVIVEERMGGKLSLYNIEGGVCCRIEINKL